MEGNLQKSEMLMETRPAEIRESVQNSKYMLEKHQVLCMELGFSAW